jgi:hypothetical protein
MKACRKALGMGSSWRIIIGSIASGGLALVSALFGPWIGALVMPSAIAQRANACLYVI